MTKIKDKTSPDPRVNLDILATYLEGLPADYAQFEMDAFLQSKGDDRALLNYVRNNGSVASCGTAACAVGHGPAAHLFFNDQEYDLLITQQSAIWFQYAKRVFQVAGLDFEWMFGGCWAYCDNTVGGAAARIRYYLEHGEPEDFDPDEVDAQDYVALYADYVKA